MAGSVGGEDTGRAECQTKVAMASILGLKILRREIMVLALILQQLIVMGLEWEERIVLWRITTAPLLNACPPSLPISLLPSLNISVFFFHPVLFSAHTKNVVKISWFYSAKEHEQAWGQVQRLPCEFLDFIKRYPSKIPRRLRSSLAGRCLAKSCRYLLPLLQNPRVKAGSRRHEHEHMFMIFLILVQNNLRIGRVGRWMDR